MNWHNQQKQVEKIYLKKIVKINKIRNLKKLKINSKIKLKNINNLKKKIFFLVTPKNTIWGKMIRKNNKKKKL